jgi:hypothetical protein
MSDKLQKRLNRFPMKSLELPCLQLWQCHVWEQVASSMAKKEKKDGNEILQKLKKDDILIFWMKM